MKHCYKIITGTHGNAEKELQEYESTNFIYIKGVATTETRTTIVIWVDGLKLKGRELEKLKDKEK